jgi:putative zinc finger protein
VSCERALALSDELVDGGISREGAVWLAEHLAECPACAQRLSRMRAAEEIFRRETSVEPPADLAARVAASVWADRLTPAAAPPRSTTLVAVVVIGLAAAALALGPIAGPSLASWLAPLGEIARARPEAALPGYAERIAAAWRALVAAAPSPPPGGWGPVAAAAVALQVVAGAWLLARGGRKEA